MQFSFRCDEDISDPTYYWKEVTILVICCKRNRKIWRSPIDVHGYLGFVYPKNPPCWSRAGARVDSSIVDKSENSLNIVEDNGVNSLQQSKNKVVMVAHFVCLLFTAFIVYTAQPGSSKFYGMTIKVRKSCRPRSIYRRSRSRVYHEDSFPCNWSWILDMSIDNFFLIWKLVGTNYEVWAFYPL